MEERVTEYTECYLLHDPIGNAEGAIAEFETEKLVKAEQQGAVFIAVYNTGRREIVKAEDIRKPKPRMNGVTLVQPVYVDDRMKAIVNVFEALEGSSLLAINSATATVAPTAAENEAKQTFAEALAALKAIVCGEGASDGDNA